MLAVWRVVTPYSVRRVFTLKYDVRVYVHFMSTIRLLLSSLLLSAETYVKGCRPEICLEGCCLERFRDELWSCLYCVKGLMCLISGKGN